MPYIKVDLRRLEQLESQLNRLPSCINSTATAVKSVRSGLDWDVASEDRIDRRLRTIASELDECKRRMQNTVRFIDSAIQQYDKAEKSESLTSKIGQNVNKHRSLLLQVLPTNANIYDMLGTNGTLLMSLTLSALPLSVSKAITSGLSNISKAAGTETSAITKFLKNELKISENGCRSAIVETDIDQNGYGNTSSLQFLSNKKEVGVGVSEFGKYTDKDAFYEYDHKRYWYRNSYVEGDEDKLYETKKWSKEIGTIGEIKAATGIGGSLIDYDLSGKSEYANGKVEANIGNAEAHGSISAGMYLFDKDGNKKIAPSVDAELGASVSLIELGAEGKIGLGKNNDMLGAYGNAEVAVGEAEAKLKGKMSLFNDDGSLNPELHASASAEAIAAEARASAGVSVLGADVGVTGSVNFGIGAHADVGIVDGKLKVDIGASLGVGVSAGFEVDLSGVKNTIMDFSESLFGWL